MRPFIRRDTALHHRRAVRRLFCDARLAHSARDRCPQRFCAASVGHPHPRFVPRQIDLPVISKRRCLEYQIFVHRHRQAFAGYFSVGCGSCNGDSDGTLLQYDETERPVLVGGASIAVQHSMTDVQTMYTRAYVGTFISGKEEAVTLTNFTVAYVLPEANRTHPNGKVLPSCRHLCASRRPPESSSRSPPSRPPSSAPSLCDGVAPSEGYDILYGLHRRKQHGLYNQ